MRISFNYMSFKHLFDIQKAASTMTDEGEKVTKGRSLLKPEDNPADYANAMNIQRLIDEATQFTENAESALTWIENADNELQQAVDIISQAKNQYAIAGMNDSQDATSRKALAADVESLMQALQAVGNANYNGRYIFSGYKTDTEAFAVNEKEVSAVASSSPGFDIYTRSTFSDMAELSEGAYSMKLEFQGDLVTISLQDSGGNDLFIDSSGNDESASDGNRTTLSYTTTFEPGSIVNTGTGISIKMPDTNPSVPTVKIDFNYKPGGDIQYHGDSGHINSSIGYNQDVDLNQTGSEIFMETSRVLRGTRYNSVNDINITKTTKFSQISGANSSLSDGIEVFGTDHNGLSLGVATLVAPNVTTLDMTSATLAQRSVNLEYGDRNYTITADQQSYDDMEELVFDLNRKLESQGLASEVEAIADGSKVVFSTLKSGNTVQLDITGSTNNTLGFTAQQVSVTGKDTTFEFGYDSYSTTTLENIHQNIPANSDITLYINNQQFTISDPSAFAPTYPDAATYAQAQLDSQLQSLGMYHSIDAVVTDNAGALDFSFKLVNENYDNTTYLTTSISNVAGTIPVGEDYQYSSPRGIGYPSGDEKNVGDFLEFIEDLYGNTVNATLENGKIIVEDIRTGTSKISFSMNEQNTGIGFPKGGNAVHFEGKFTGTEDDQWRISVTNTTGSNLEFVITDSTSTVIDTINYDVTNYNGEPIYLTQGVSIVIGDDTLLNTATATDIIAMDVKADNNLSFGDMNIVQDAENVNAFNSMNNLYNALMFNITEQGVSAPSAWGNEELDSTASPYNAGEFTGNYNDQWTYTVSPSENTSSFYIQQELKASSGTLKDISGTVALDFDFTMDIGGTSQTFNINGNYNDWSTVASDMNNAIQTYAGTLTGSDQKLAEQVKVELTGSQLIMNSGSGVVEISLKAQDDTTLNHLGILDLTAPNDPLGDMGFTNNREIIASENDVVYDLRDKTDEERTLTLDYMDNGVATTIDITVPATEFSNAQDLADAVQTELNTAMGVAAPNRIDVGVYENQLYFSLTDVGVGTTVSDIHVSGDHKATLGYYSKGDEATVKITSAGGDTINEVRINTANQDHFISDGVYMGFDTGVLFTSDSYTTAVGSGIEYELSVLDKAETQMVKALTTVGTSQNRVESVINFSSTLITTNEGIKGVYLQSTSYDQTKAMSDYAAAQHAYEAALNVTAKIMQTSLLDYLG